MHIILFQGKKIFRYVREAEYKYNIRNKNYDDKLVDFFEVYDLIISVSMKNLKTKIFK